MDAKSVTTVAYARDASARVSRARDGIADAPRALHVDAGLNSGTVEGFVD